MNMSIKFGKEKRLERYKKNKIYLNPIVAFIHIQMPK